MSVMTKVLKLKADTAVVLQRVKRLERKLKA